MSGQAFKSECDLECSSSCGNAEEGISQIPLARLQSVGLLSRKKMHLKFRAQKTFQYSGKPGFAKSRKDDSRETKGKRAKSFFSFFESAHLFS